MCRKIAVLAVLLVPPGGCAERDSAEPRIATRQQPAAGPVDRRPVVLVVGTSLTAGYGLAAEEAYPSLLQEKLDSAGYRYRVVNAGESGGTSAGGVRRVDWLLRHPVAVLVLELGANDGLRGQDVGALEANLQTIIDRTRAAHPDAAVVVAGMEAPPNLGSAYTDAFRRVFQEVARRNGSVLIPFLLEGVAGLPALNQPDGIHPTAEGHQVLAENVWAVLEPVVAGLSRPDAAESPSGR